MFYQLPPVGNPVCLTGADQSTPVSEPDFTPYTPHYYASGTAALAAAISAAIRLKGVEKPEVLLPAYGCPDLVSAALYAGAVPVLVDLERDRPWLDLELLTEHINPSTVAIIAVSLFGIAERMEELQQIAGQHGVFLIEDSAQAFPANGENDCWSGDLVVVSFGRGKPVSLLGGGAVLVRDQELGSQLIEATDGVAGTARWRVRAVIYNLMISPWLYWVPQGLPFLHLGETRYEPLTTIAPMEPSARRLLTNNIVKYQEDKGVVQASLAIMLEETGGEPGCLLDLPLACQVPGHVRLLRYPLLVDSTHRDPCLRRLQQAGLGPSCMYPTSLANTRGLEPLFSGHGDFPVADDFARRVLTLPTHRRVSKADIEKMGRILRSCFSEARG